VETKLLVSFAFIPLLTFTSWLQTGILGKTVLTMQGRPTSIWDYRSKWM